jgi:hypothetical protein
MARATCKGDHDEGMGMSLECIQQQHEFIQVFKSLSPVASAAAVAKRVHFIDRPTKQDIERATTDDTFIVVRIRIPSHWRKELTPEEGMLRVFKLCRAMLQELDIVGGNPRVFLMADSCTAADEFKEKVRAGFCA